VPGDVRNGILDLQIDLVARGIFHFLQDGLVFIDQILLEDCQRILICDSRPEAAFAGMMSAIG
jgi:hypothetical protein